MRSSISKNCLRNFKNRNYFSKLKKLFFFGQIKNIFQFDYQFRSHHTPKNTNFSLFIKYFMPKQTEVKFDKTAQLTRWVLAFIYRELSRDNITELYI